MERLVEQLGEVIAEHSVAFAYLFGSAARDRARQDSDVDVAVHFEPGLDAAERFERCLQLGVALERALGRDVDVIDLEEAPVRLAGRILTERVVILGLERPERVRYETELFRRYIDVEYHAQRLDAELLSAIADGRR